MTRAILSTAVATAALLWAMPSQAQLVGGGAAGDVAGGVTGTLSEDPAGRLGAEGDIAGQAGAYGRLDSGVDDTFGRAESRVRRGADRAADASARAEANARAAAERAQSARVSGGASAQGSASADVDDDPSVRASGGVSASGGVTTDD